MQKIILFIYGIINLNVVSAQNLVVNPDAESLPRGTGWSIISQGASTCLLVPTSNFVNWTMIPDGSTNYPYDHTTGAAGGTVFYSGCSSGLQGPFELRQDIDLSADAATIDAGAMTYVFTGHMQTPVSNQTDEGRFIVDYLNTSNVVLKTSYTSSWQSYYLGSGSGWVVYTNTRLAPVGTRIIRIRMQTEIFFNPPAINVYFDDITLVKPVVLPVNLMLFTATEAWEEIYLHWKVADELNFLKYDLEQSNNGIDFIKIATLPGGRTYYSYTDKKTPGSTAACYYRLKMTDNNGKFSYSYIVPVFFKGQPVLQISPNPAKNYFTISGLQHPGVVSLIDANGKNIMTNKTNGSTYKINISSIPAGVYFIRVGDGKNIVFKKLVVQN